MFSLNFAIVSFFFIKVSCNKDIFVPYRCGQQISVSGFVMKNDWWRAIRPDVDDCEIELRTDEDTMSQTQYISLRVEKMMCEGDGYVTIAGQAGSSQSHIRPKIYKCGKTRIDERKGYGEKIDLQLPTAKIYIKNVKNLKLRIVGYAYHYNNNNCAIDYVKCDDTPCIKEELRCDGVYHCHDGHDEKNCSFGDRIARYLWKIILPVVLLLLLTIGIVTFLLLYFCCGWKEKLQNRKLMKELNEKSKMEQEEMLKSLHSAASQRNLSQSHMASYSNANTNYAGTHASMTPLPSLDTSLHTMHSFNSATPMQQLPNLSLDPNLNPLKLPNLNMSPNHSLQQQQLMNNNNIQNYLPQLRSADLVATQQHPSSTPISSSGQYGYNSVQNIVLHPQTATPSTTMPTPLQYNNNRILNNGGSGEGNDISTMLQQLTPDQQQQLQQLLSNNNNNNNNSMNNNNMNLMNNMSNKNNNNLMDNLQNQMKQAPEELQQLLNGTNQQNVRNVNNLQSNLNSNLQKVEGNLNSNLQNLQSNLQNTSTNLQSNLQNTAINLQNAGTNLQNFPSNIASNANNLQNLMNSQIQQPVQQLVSNVNQQANAFQKNYSSILSNTSQQKNFP
ncbi:hypothetical protein SNEBB_003342 [Seison nebaliae]|nr:hypothetical protein SNEBB_003342 [Seison nebaliae]